ncbi:beta-parvin isoform X1 [Phymastichus coffea]|uniref:beta-parvin isoform X1 n=2 Tax=Phymastichus coffea TaxID=108790 RepID=UPI00273CBAE4|nr:beta-parvin isoform X1 [Phymastichus coffea]
MSGETGNSITSQSSSFQFMPNQPNDSVIGDDDVFEEDDDMRPQVVGVVKKKQTRDKSLASEGDNGVSVFTDKRRLNSTGLITGLAVMASPRPQSPRPAPISAKKEDKEESFWDKIGTLGRKKRIKEVQEVQEEGKHAIESPGFAAMVDMPPEDYNLDENEERSMIAPKSLEVPKVRELIQVLIEWINDELADQRIIVKDITEDLYDGQVLQKLLEKLTGSKLNVPEVTQSEEGQRHKLSVVLNTANRVLDCYPPYKWSVESIHSRNIVAILHLLVSLARQYRAPVRLPELVSVFVVVVTKKDGQLIHRTVKEEITSTYDDLGMRCERDAFDALFDCAPEKLAVVKKSLVTFVNKHLSKVHLEVTDLDNQFHDGVFLILLLGLLEGFFVPLGSFHLTPKTHEHKVHNVAFAFELMQDIGLPKPKARPEDIVNLDLKSTLRVLYNLFSKYKGIN